MDFNNIKKLVCCPAISGREKKIADVIVKMIAQYTDDISVDPLGNIISVKYGNGKASDRKKIMLCAHMDEIGFMVTSIDDKGYIRFGTIGGINLVSASYSNVIFENGIKGVLVPENGILGNAITYDKCYVDIGAKSRNEALKKVSVGDYFVILPTLSRLLGKRIVGRPLDDRIGCAIVIDIAEMVAKSGTENDIYYVFSVQEEVGCRGAKTAAFNIRPDYALCFDVTGTGDSIGSKPMVNSVGGGASIKLKDSSVICDSEVCRILRKLSDEKSIKSQTEILLYGGTDTSSIQLAGTGCRAGAISIPTRYIHSNVELVDLGDVEACTKLAYEFIKYIR